MDFCPYANELICMADADSSSLGKNSEGSPNNSNRLVRPGINLREEIIFTFYKIRLTFISKITIILDNSPNQKLSINYSIE